MIQLFFKRLKLSFSKNNEVAIFEKIVSNYFYKSWFICFSLFYLSSIKILRIHSVVSRIVYLQIATTTVLRFGDMCGGVCRGFFVCLFQIDEEMLKHGLIF